MPKIVRTLEQDEWWYGQDSFPYRITEMDDYHISNVIEWLRRRASQLRLQHYWDEFLEHHDLDDCDVGPNTERQFIAWLGANPALDADAARWLDAKPLTVALRRELRSRGIVDGIVVDLSYDGELEDDSAANGRAVGARPGFRRRTALG